MNELKLEEIEATGDFLNGEYNFTPCGIAKFPKSNELDGDGIKLFVDIDKQILSIAIYKDHKYISTKYFKIKEDNLTRDKFYDIMLSLDTMNLLKEIYPYRTLYIHE